MSTSDTDASAAKAAARAEARDRRRSGDRPDPDLLADRAVEHLEALPGPRRVTCYASYGTEPDTGELRRRLAAAGYEVLLPRVDGEHLEWVVDRPDRGGLAGPPGRPETVVSSMGIAEPTGAAVDLLPLRAMLVPALAVTAEGDRLGKGGGYYDRVLSALHDVPIVALVGDADVVDRIPTQEHDMRVHAIITPTRAMRCTAP